MTKLKVSPGNEGFYNFMYIKPEIFAGRSGYFDMYGHRFYFKIREIN